MLDYRLETHDVRMKCDNLTRYMVLSLRKRFRSSVAFIFISRIHFFLREFKGSNDKIQLLRLQEKQILLCKGLVAS